MWHFSKRIQCATVRVKVTVKQELGSRKSKQHFSRFTHCTMIFNRNTFWPTWFWYKKNFPTGIRLIYPSPIADLHLAVWHSNFRIGQITGSRSNVTSKVPNERQARREKVSQRVAILREELHKKSCFKTLVLDHKNHDRPRNDRKHPQRATLENSVYEYHVRIKILTSIPLFLNW